MDQSWSQQVLRARTFKSLNFCFQQGASSENVFFVAVLYNILPTDFNEYDFLDKVIEKEQIDINKKIFPGNKTALHVAAEYGSGLYVYSLLKHGADVFAQDNLHRYPIDCAIISFESFIQKNASQTGENSYRLFHYKKKKNTNFYREMIAKDKLKMTNKDKTHAYWLLQCIDDLQETMDARLKQKQIILGKSLDR